MWILVIVIGFIIYSSLCDADKKSCLSGIIYFAVTIGIIYGSSVLNSMWENATQTIMYIILALIIIVIIWITIQTWIDSAKRNKQEKLIRQVLSNAKCPYCQGKKIRLPNYYGITHDINKQELYCQDCKKFWYYKEE